MPLVHIPQSKSELGIMTTEKITWGWVVSSPYAQFQGESDSRVWVSRWKKYQKAARPLSSITFSKEDRDGDKKFW
jgi:hypothetical protein